MSFQEQINEMISSHRDLVPVENDDLTPATTSDVAETGNAPENSNHDLNTRTLSAAIAKLCEAQPCNCGFDTKTGLRVTEHHEDGSITCITAPCDSLKCSYCSILRCNRIIDSLPSVIVDKDLRYHVKITLPSNFSGKSSQEVMLSKALDKLIKTANKFYAKKPSYLWMLGGKTADGLHMHLLSSVDLSEAALGVNKNKQTALKWLRTTGGCKVESIEFSKEDALDMSLKLVRNLMETVQSKPLLGCRHNSSKNIRFKSSKNKGVIHKIVFLSDIHRLQEDTENRLDQQ